MIERKLWIAAAAALAAGTFSCTASDGSLALKDAPLDIGIQRQLFVDDFVVASTRNLTRAFHFPQRHPDNPIIVGDRPWENWVIEVNGRPIVYDEEAGEFRMYYVAPQMEPSAPSGERYRTCLAVSRDGLHWQKPDLGQIEWEGGQGTNILRPGREWMRRPNVILDPDDPDPERRYKMMYVDFIDGQTAIVKAYSRNGVEWNLNGDGRPWFRKHHSSNLLGWDPRVQRYVLFPRTVAPGRGTSVGRSTSGDFIAWSEPETVLAPTPEDRGKTFKGNAAFLYEGVYFGFLWVFDGSRSAESELTYSRDGTDWKRSTPGRYYFPRGAAGAWDSEMVLPVAPVVFDDQIWIYYSGWNLPYSKPALTRAHQGWFENGQRMQRAVGLATLRLDGFASLDAGVEEGVLVTKTLRGTSGRLIVNADVRGELRAEILDESGKVLPGYGRHECVPIRGDDTRHSIRWNHATNLDRLSEQALKIRFLMRDANLFSFQIGEQVEDDADTSR